MFHSDFSASDINSNAIDSASSSLEKLRRIVYILAQQCPSCFNSTNPELAQWMKDCEELERVHAKIHADHLEHERKASRI